MEIFALLPDWSAKDSAIWWQRFCVAIKRAIREVNIDFSKISSVGISYHIHDFLLFKHFVILI